MCQARNWKKGSICLIVVSMLVLGMIAVAHAEELVVWDQWLAPFTVKAIETLDANFEKMHPGVRVERSGYPHQEMTQMLRIALAAGKGPDVAYADIGVGEIGPSIRAGHIMDLTDVWKERGWDQKLHTMSKELITYAGKTWGIGNELEFTPVMYNKKIFADLGIKPPKSVPEMEQIAEKCRGAGYIPLALMDRTPWGFWMVFNYIVQSYLGLEPVRKVIVEGGTWDVPGYTEAIEKIAVEWRKRDFYPEDVVALDYDDSVMLFAQSLAAMHPQGTWVLARYEEVVEDFEVGMFPFPRPSADQPPVVPSLCGSGYMVNARTKRPQLALDYIDYLMASEEAARIWYEIGVKVPPLRKSFPDLKASPLIQRTAEMLFGEADVLWGYQLDAFCPAEVLDHLNTGGQALLTDQMTPKEFTDTWVRLWEKGQKEGLTKDTFRLE